MDKGFVCTGCRWYDEWFGVCCNGESEYCADCPPDWLRECPVYKKKVSAADTGEDVHGK